MNLDFSDDQKFLQDEARKFFDKEGGLTNTRKVICLLYTSPSPRDKRQSRMPSSA